jgi:hypothetical protein
MPDLIATKSLRYATRRLMAGDEFTANARDARVLIAIKKATAKPDTGAATKRDPLDHDGNGKKGGAKRPRRAATKR